MAAEISPAELQRRLTGGEELCLVDVRSAAEYRAGHLPGALHLPFWLLPLRHGRLAAAKESLVVVYCEHGPRALLAQQMLAKRGYLQVCCLRGHMSTWRRERRPLDAGP